MLRVMCLLGFSQVRNKSKTGQNNFSFLDPNLKYGFYLLFMITLTVMVFTVQL